MQAADRLFQMDLQRRRSLGRRAEVFGESAKSDDALIRTIGIGSWGRVNAEAAREKSPRVWELVHAWTSGVNARIAEVRAGTAPRDVGFDELGFDPEPWDVSDAFTIGKAIVFQNGNQLEFDVLASLIQRYEPALFAAAPFYGPISDAFIVGGVTPASGSTTFPDARAPRA